MMDFDVLVIGAGMAGLRAAIAAAAAGCRTGFVTKSLPVAETATAMNGGGWVHPSAALPPDEYAREVMHTGRGLNDRRLVQLLAHYGEDDFRSAAQRFGWDYFPFNRSLTIVTSPALKPGYRTTHALACAAVAAGATPLEELTVGQLLVEGGRCRGIRCVDKNGAQISFSARAVVLCTGGFGALFPRTTNPARMTGDGHVLALEAGCRLRDLEFVQFFPFGLEDSKLPHNYVAIPVPPGTRLLDENDEEVLPRHFPPGVDLQKAGTEFRDATTIAILRERAAGHTPLIDLTQTHREDWDRYTITSLLPRWNRDPSSARLRVSPIAHFTMGGVVVDENLETDVPGLFVAGELAGGVHGANRHAGNALLACLVHGRLAGEAAARSALSWTSSQADAGAQPAPESPSYLLGPDPLDGEDAVHQANGVEGGSALATSDRLRRLRSQLQQVLGRHLNPLRTAGSLQTGLAALAELAPAVDAQLPRGQNARTVIELRAAIKVAQWAMQAALIREESRGAHFRDDFPTQDDDRWLRPIIVRRGASETQLEAQIAPGPMI